MPKEWNDDEVAALIKENVEIVRADRLEAFLRTRFAQTNDDKNNPANAPPNSGNGNQNPGGNGPKAKKSLWWGEQE